MKSKSGGVVVCLVLFVSWSAPIQSAFGQGWESRTISGMKVELYTPTNSGTLGSGRSLLIVLSGCAQTTAELRDYGNFQGPADDVGMVVAIPAPPNGGVVAGCWDYYGSGHTRANRHNGNVIGLAQTLTEDAENRGYGIDPNQVYVAGLSSGGGEVSVLGCLAPDIFAGLGIVSGPAVGTDLMQFNNMPAGLLPSTVAGTCTGMAGSNHSYFATQVVSVFQPAQDPVVDPDYAKVNAGAFVTIYTGEGASFSESSFSVAALPGVNPSGEGTLWSDPVGGRVSLIQIPGMKHAWPGGSGRSGGTFVSADGVHYAAYLASFFYGNSRRVGTRPVVEFGKVTVDGCCVSIEGTAVDPDGRQITTLSIDVGGKISELTLGPGGAWSERVCELVPGDYIPVVTAVNDQGGKTVKNGESFTITRCGNLPPTVVISGASPQADCVTVTGTATDADGDPLTVTIAFDDGGPTALTLGVGGSFRHNPCGFAPGTHEVSVKAVDGGGLADEEIASFLIEKPVGKRPVVTITKVSTNMDCVRIEGTATDPDGNLSSASVAVDRGAESPLQLGVGGGFTFEKCELALGDHNAIVKALDQTGLSGLKDVPFTIIARVNRSPVVTIGEPRVDRDCVEIGGTASDPDGDVLTVSYSLDGGVAVQLTLDAGGNWVLNGCTLARGWHTAAVIAVDLPGLQTTAEKPFEIVWDNVDPENRPPVVACSQVQVSADCVDVEGTAFDPDRDALTLTIAFDGGAEAQLALGSDGTWNHRQCALKGGAHKAVVTATDQPGLQGSAAVEFNIASQESGCGVETTTSNGLVGPTGLLLLLPLLLRRNRFFGFACPEVRSR